MVGILSTFSNFNLHPLIVADMGRRENLFATPLYLFYAAWRSIMSTKPLPPCVLHPPVCWLPRLLSCHQTHGYLSPRSSSIRPHANASAIHLDRASLGCVSPNGTNGQKYKISLHSSQMTSNPSENSCIFYSSHFQGERTYGGPIMLRPWQHFFREAGITIWVW